MGNVFKIIKEVDKSPFSNFKKKYKGGSPGGIFVKFSGHTPRALLNQTPIFIFFYVIKKFKMDNFMTRYYCPPEYTN